MEKDPKNLINKKVEEMKGKNLTIGGPVIMKEKNKEAQRLIGELGSLKISIEESTTNIENLEKEKGGIKTETLETGKEQEKIKTETLEIGEELNEVRVQKEKQKGELNEKKKELEETIKLKEELEKQKTESVIEIKKPVEIKIEPIQEIKTEPIKEKPQVVEEKKEEPPEKILEGYVPLTAEDMAKLKEGDEVFEVNPNLKGAIAKKRVEKDMGTYFILSGPGAIKKLEKGKSISEIVKAEETKTEEKKEPVVIKEELKELKPEIVKKEPEPIKEEPPKIVAKEKKEPEPVKTAPPPEKTEKEIPLETKLNDAREKYAAGYKQFMAERKKESAWYVNLKRKVFGSKVKEEKIPQNLKDLEKDYDKLTTEYGRKMYADKKIELEKSSKSVEERKTELAHYKQKEIFTKVILEEQEKLNVLKAENLPPKEKGILKKSLDWYIKQNRFTKVAISVTLSTPIIASFLPGAIGAAGGLGLYLGSRYVRGLVGGVFGQVAAKGYEKFVKERYTERKEEALEELSKKFGENMTEKELSEYKKQYAEILEKEKTSKRNRIIHKAMVAIVAGGAAGYGTGLAVHHYLSPEQVLAGGTRTDISEHIKGRGVIEHAKGGAESAETGGVAEPKGIQEFMKTDSTQEAIKLGLYAPGSSEESAFVQHGTMSFVDENGHRIEVPYSSSGAIQTIDDLKSELVRQHVDITQGHIETDYTDMKGIDHHQILIKGDNIEQYGGTMGHATAPETHATTGEEYTIKAETPLSGETHVTPAETIIAPEHVIPLETGETGVGGEAGVTGQAGAEAGATSTAGQTGPTGVGGEAGAGTENIPSGLGDNPFHLSAEMLKEVQATYDKLIDHLFHDNASLQAWNGIKDSTENYSAEKLMAWDETNVNETFKPLIHDIHTMKEITGLDPQGKTLIHSAETPTEYFKHDLEKAALDGNLEELKAKLLAL